MISPVKSKIVKFTLKISLALKQNAWKDYAQLPPTKENPDHILIHVGTNDLPTRRQPDVIAEDII